jgi:hypothetical protein
MPSSRLFLVAASLALSTPAWAIDPSPGEVLGDVEIHGFVSQGFIKSIRNNYLVANTENFGSFDMTEVGLNFTKAITDRMRVGVQLFGGGFLGTDKYDFKADWFYLDYRWRDWLGLRAGRVKLPFGLYNEINDIDAARVPILLPQSTYPVQNRNFLLAQTGFELYGYLGSPRMGALEYRLYGGTILLEATSNPSSPLNVRNIYAPYVAGGRLMWETPLQGLRAGGSFQVLRLDADIQAAAMPTASAHVKVPALLWIASVEYDGDVVLFASEYSRWRSEVDSNNPMVIPSTPAVTSERAYAMVAVRVAPWVQLGTYYSIYYPNAEVREGRQSRQHDVAGTLRIDLTPNWLVKLEGHYLNGTAALSSALNDNRPLSTLSSRWATFLLKTTAYF